MAEKSVCHFPSGDVVACPRSSSRCDRHKVKVLTRLCRRQVAPCLKVANLSKAEDKRGSRRPLYSLPSLFLKTWFVGFLPAILFPSSCSSSPFPWLRKGKRPRAASSQPRTLLIRIHLDLPTLFATYPNFAASSAVGGLILLPMSYPRWRLASNTTAFQFAPLWTCM